jgi:hypothetical protein
MVATPTNGTFTFQGASGRVYNVDSYSTDVPGAQVTFDSGSGAGAGTNTFWKLPENAVLKDFSIADDLTATVALVLTADGAQVPASRVVIANQLNSLPYRPPMSIGFKAGTNFGAIQA